VSLLVYLTEIDASGNNLTGAVSSGLFYLAQIERVNLANNDFNGARARPAWRPRAAAHAPMRGSMGLLHGRTGPLGPRMPRALGFFPIACPHGTSLAPSWLAGPHRPSPPGTLYSCEPPCSPPSLG
jgi:hypothetical protein